MNKKSIFKDGANKYLTHPQKNKGITLIALIITIVVMLILVAVVVSTTINSNLINKVKSAKGEWEGAEDRDSNIAGATIGGEYYGSLQDYVTHFGGLSAYGEDGMTDGVLVYKKTSDTEVAVFKLLDTNAVEVEIPSDITLAGKSYDVTTIGASAFRNCTSLTSITIPNSVTSIGDWAFSMCSNLTNVTILDGVTSIGSYVFLGCTNLTNITIPNSVTSIGYCVFCGCSNLASITIPDGVVSIGNHAFGSFNMVSLNLPGCTSLTEITIPKSVTSIGVDPFLRLHWLNKHNCSSRKCKLF